MSMSYNVGDAVLLQIAKNHQAIGLIKYIGPLVDNMMTEYVGVELVEPINNGHDGTINGFTYFTATNGHGFHCKLTNIIRVLLASELITKLREQYDHIQKLESIIINNTKKTSLTLTGRYSLESNKTNPSKKQSLESISIMSVKRPYTPKALNIYSYPISMMDPKTSLNTQSRTKNSASIMTEINSSSYLTDHKYSLSSSYSYSDTEQEIKHRKTILIKRKKRKKKRKSKKITKKAMNSHDVKLKPKNKNRRKRSKSLSISTSSNSYVPTPYPMAQMPLTPLSPLTLTQSHTQLLTENMDFLYNEPYTSSYQPMNGYTNYKPNVYIKYNEYCHKKLPSLSAMSKSPKKNVSKII